MNNELLTTGNRQLKTVFDICRMFSTNSPFFMQNEPKFRKVKLNVSSLMARDYEKKDTWWSGKNEPKTNPNEPNSKKAKMNVYKVLTKGYKNKANWTLGENEPKTNPISKAKNAAFRLFAVGSRMFFKSLSGKCRLKIILEVYPIIW